MIAKSTAAVLATVLMFGACSLASCAGNYLWPEQSACKYEPVKDACK